MLDLPWRSSLQSFFLIVCHVILCQKLYLSQKAAVLSFFVYPLQFLCHLWILEKLFVSSDVGETQPDKDQGFYELIRSPWFYHELFFLQFFFQFYYSIQFYFLFNSIQFNSTFFSTKNSIVQSVENRRKFLADYFSSEAEHGHASKEKERYRCICICICRE